jgi:hypothetical protein
VNIKQLVVFAILMENNDGILGKAPSYLLEKYEACKLLPNPESLLDSQNKAKFKDYLKTWLKEAK